MLAAIDVGSNTVRLLVGDVVGKSVRPQLYQRCITRLGGGFRDDTGLSEESCQRTLAALESFAATLRSASPQVCRAVATEALRRARNARTFVEQVRSRTGIQLEVVDGHEEARLSSRGVLSVVAPLPEACLIVDIGGGSTELVFCSDGRPVWSTSLELGTVRLCEEHLSTASQQEHVRRVVADAQASMRQAGLAWKDVTVVGTAGTATTLAALDLQLTRYDWRRVNNHRLARARLAELQGELQPLSPSAREALPGMEPGRGDLILPGLLIVLELLSVFRTGELVVSDFGLLEGILLELAAPSEH